MAFTRVRGAVRRRIQRARLSQVSRRVIDERLTYLNAAAMRVLEGQARRITKYGVHGDVLECGIALGGSAIMLASESRGRNFHGYDVFGMIPPPTASDPPEVHERYATIVSGASKGIRGDAYYGYRTDLYDEVLATFSDYGLPLGESVHLHSGLFEDTLHPTAPVALAHIDCDWHGPVKLCIERIWPHLAISGALIFDDYCHYGGCTQAVDEFVAATPDAKMVRSKPNAIVKRTSLGAARRSRREKSS